MEPKTIAVLIVVAMIIVFFVWKKWRHKKISEGGRGSPRAGEDERRRRY